MAVRQLVESGEWRVKSLGDILTLRYGKSQKGIIVSDGKFPIFATSGEVGRTNDFLYNKPSVIIGRKGTIDKPQYVDTPFWTIDTAYYSEISEQANPKYLFYLLSTIDWYSYNEASGVPSLNAKTVESIEVFIPKLPEQEAIAAALSDADALIAALEGLIAKKRQIKQGAMQELLTGKKRLAGFSGDWEVKSLGKIAHIQTGGCNNQDKIEDGKYPFFVRSATVERINSYSYDCEAILVPGEGNIGNIFHYINGKFDVHQRVYAITQFIDGVSGKFVYLYMAQNFGKHALKNTVKATVDSLRLPTFLEFEVLLPPTKEEQTAIAEILSDMDAEIEMLAAKLSKVRQVKQGMMSELLMGRVRLVDSGELVVNSEKQEREQ